MNAGGGWWFGVEKRAVRASGVDSWLTWEGSKPGFVGGFEAVPPSARRRSRPAKRKQG